MNIMEEIFEIKFTETLILQSAKPTRQLDNTTG